MNAAALLLQARDLRARREDGQPFQQPLSIEMRAGETVCLIGPNGGGKTAYLRALAAVDRPATGAIKVLGKDALKLDTDAWRALRLRAAYIGEGAPLLSVVNGLINVTLPAMYHRLGTAPQVQAAAQDLLTFLDYPGRQDLLPAYLNQHERLLLAIARCLMLSPELMFLDEPFHMTDNACREREAVVYGKLTAEKGLGLLIATHNLGFVRRHADQIVFLHPDWIGCFAGWKVLNASKQPEVRAFLDSGA
ncbi:MAG TPA: ATP-binding cassette domain-containing protein [Gammaproteobacteria bacterium]|jgi:ABC-type polar amino acid transport system ATPase subunit|nr:ATP-binding cassette domain-containing protein [Gammaproteobacteria bacterium]